MLGSQVYNSHSLWSQFLAAYGGSKCVGTSDGESCREGVTDPEVLTCAHLFGDGKTHRQRLNPVGRGGGKAVWQDLKNRNWPQDEGIAVQCANCQLRDKKRAGVK